MAIDYEADFLDFIEARLKKILHRATIEENEKICYKTGFTDYLKKLIGGLKFDEKRSHERA